MRKLRLVAVIVFVAWGSHTLYKYLNNEKSPEIELPEIIVEQVQTPVEDVKPVEDIAEIINNALTDDAIELKIEEVKPKYEHKPIKRKKFKYCVKVSHKHETTHEIVMRHFIND